MFHSVTTGASNDIEQATKLARAMISRFGMSEEFGFVAFETVSNQYLGAMPLWPAPQRPRRGWTRSHRAGLPAVPPGGGAAAGQRG